MYPTDPTMPLNQHQNTRTVSPKSENHDLWEACTEAVEKGAANANDIYLYVYPDQRFSAEEILLVAYEIFLLTN